MTKAKITVQTSTGGIAVLAHLLALIVACTSVREAGDILELYNSFVSSISLTFRVCESDSLEKSVFSLYINSFFSAAPFTFTFP